MNAIYAECGGPGGLQLAEFMADKMGVRPGARLLDIGIDPDDDRLDDIPHIVARKPD